MWGWLKSIGTWITGGSKTAEKTVDMVDKAFYTDQEKAEQDSKDTNDAGFRESSHVSSNIFDSVIDGFNRLPRPAFATWAFGELVGWWNINIEKISDSKMQLIIIIVTFYFGARVILKDLPAIIKSMRK